MLRILGEQLDPSPLHPRREFLRVGALGSLGLGLPELLALQSEAHAAGSTTFGRAKRCILMHLWGASPHQDTFDLKPEAPIEVRGPFLPIPTNVPGVEIGDHLPLLARHAEKYTIVRSVNHTEGDHQAAFHDMMTGNRYQWLDKRNAAKPTDNPNIGAVLARLKPRGNGLPEYVQLPSLLQTNSGKIVPGQNAGFLGKSFDPFLVKAVDNYKPAHDPLFGDFNPPAFRNPGGSLSGIRLDRRRKLLESVEDIEGTAAVAAKHGFQLNTHAIGDRANREVLDLYERTFVASGASGANLRWRIEHAQHIHPDDIPRFGSLGVIAAMQGVHCTSDAPYVLPRLGEQRAREGAYVWQSLLKSGAVVTNGTDAPVEDVDPIESYYATVTRKGKSGKAFYPEQAMSRMAALRSYTIACAYAAFEEDIKGTLTPGKLADVVVLSKDILTVPEEEIRDTQVLYTIVGGKVVYDASK